MKKNIVIVILLLVVLGLAGYLGYDKFLKKEEPVKENIPQTEEVKVPKEVKGLYNFTSDSVYSEANDGNIEAKYELYLYEDGTFNYNLSFPYGGHIGNYVVKDNVITLNYLFNTSTDTSLEYNNKTKTLIINEDGSLTDNENEMDIVKTNTITLKKATSREETEFLSNHETVNKIISNYTKNNNQGQ